MKKFLIFCLAICGIVAGCQKPAADPAIILETDSIQAEMEGGNFSLGYRIDNPVSGSELEVKSIADVSWIRNLFVEDGTISFDILPFESTGSRSTSLKLSYAYEGGLVESGISITQNGSDADYYLGAKTSVGELRHQEGAPLYQKIAYLSNKEYGTPGSYCMVINFLDDKPSAESDMTLGEGTYSISKSGDAGTIWECAYFKFSSNGQDFAFGPVAMKSGTLTVTASGDALAYSGEFVDAEGKTYKMNYNGEISFADRTNNSTLDEDLEVGMKDFDGTITYYGPGQYADGWKLELMDPSGAGQMLTVDLFTDSSSAESGIPDGVYKASDTRKPGTFSKGSSGSTMFVGSWFFTYSGNSVYMPSAPLNDGSISIRQLEPGLYEISFDCLDDAIFPHRITGTWTGYVDVYTIE